MSKYGKSPIPLPKGVELKIEQGQIMVKGSKGSMALPVKKGITVKIEENKALVELEENVHVPKPVHGLYRSLINNMVEGVSKGFAKRLDLVGVGFRAALEGKNLVLQVGYSIPVKIEIPKNVQVAIDKSIAILITGVDKHAVGQFAARVRAARPPEPYKGKGIRYEKEIVRKKAGKAAKGKTA